MTKKRINSNNNENIVIPAANKTKVSHRRRKKAVADEEEEEVLSDIEETARENEEPFPNTSKKAEVSKSLETSLSLVCLSESEKGLLEELSLNDILKQGSDGYPQKLFIFNGVKKYYTTRLHFFSSIRIFKERPTGHVKFECKICKIQLQAIFPCFNNLNNHVKSVHSELTKKWRDGCAKKRNSNAGVIDDDLYDLIRFFISSNTALAQLENPYLRKLLEKVIKIPCVKTFR